MYLVFFIYIHNTRNLLIGNQNGRAGFTIPEGDFPLIGGRLGAPQLRVDALVTTSVLKYPFSRYLSVYQKARGRKKIII